MEWVRGLGFSDRRRLGRAVRAGRPVGLALRGPWPVGLPFDELLPFCADARLDEPRAQNAWRERSWEQQDGGVRLRSPAGGPLPVTVLIPTHRRIPWGVPGWLRAGAQVLVVSNGASGPHSVEGARVLHLPWQGHGATRQAALAAVETPFVLFTVDDAIPMDGSVLVRLLHAMETEGWAAVMARQIPWPDTDPLTRERLRRWTPPGDRPRPWPHIDHVATLHRTAELRLDPLPDVPIAEDAWWGRGRSLGYVPAALVAHAHPRRPLDLYRRNRDIHAELLRMGHDPTVPSLRSLLAALPSCLGHGLGTETLSSAAELFGQWAGARRARDRSGE